MLRQQYRNACNGCSLRQQQEVIRDGRRLVQKRLIFPLSGIGFGPAGMQNDAEQCKEAKLMPFYCATKSGVNVPQCSERLSLRRAVAGYFEDTE